MTASVLLRYDGRHACEPDIGSDGVGNDGHCRVLAARIEGEASSAAELPFG